MIGRLILPAAALAAAGLSCPAIARDLVLEPSSNWELDYAPDSCALRRTFGEGDRQTQLEMRRFSPSTTLQTTVATKAAKIARRSYRFRFGDAEWDEIDHPLYAQFGNGLQGVIFRHALFEIPFDEDTEAREWDRFQRENDISALEAEAAAKVASVTISRAFHEDIVLNTGSLEEPFRALNGCVDDLLNRWGIDVAAHKTRSRSPLPLDPAKAVRMVSYPPKMLRQNLPGLVNVRLDIDKTGRVTDCHIQMPLSDPEFETSSCADIQHALEFEPALDRDGNPMKSYFVTAVHFRII